MIKYNRLTFESMSGFSQSFSQRFQQFANFHGRKVLFIKKAGLFVPYNLEHGEGLVKTDFTFKISLFVGVFLAKRLQICKFPFFSKIVRMEEETPQTSSQLCYLQISAQCDQFSIFKKKLHDHANIARNAIGRLWRFFSAMSISKLHSAMVTATGPTRVGCL